MAKTKENNNSEPIEKQLWKSADKLRKNIDAAEYKHVVLGLIFLKYISDAFEDLYSKLKSGKGDYTGADPEDKDEYKAENVFFSVRRRRKKALKMRERKLLRLTGYDYTTTGAYFITTCVHSRKNEFGMIENGKMKLNQYRN